MVEKIEKIEKLANSSTAVSDSPACWPALPPDAWQETRDTLHMWTQIVGKVRLALTPKVNHWWNAALHVSARGLTTSAIPYGERVFEIEFDLLEHQLEIKTCDPASKIIPLGPRSVADFYQELMSALHALKIDVKIWKMPVEIANPIAFDQDRVHAAYDREYARRFWRALVSIDDVFNVFRSRFIGKSSPAHFFWGSFDLAVTRFSGRPAPPRNDPDPVLRKIMQEAYSHEVISAGWWPGGGELKDAAFYCYAAPEPPGFARQQVRPGSALYNQQMGEFLLMHEQVRTAASPTETLLDFLQSTYEAGATLGKWDRKALERSQEPAAGAA
ncbi:MAG TPA: DUF5996 family protein [Candidatus Angelobacter sp.]|nr:DUF5996 family protein [Candidatus Angelobacter sp.]